MYELLSWGILIVIGAVGLIIGMIVIMLKGVKDLSETEFLYTRLGFSSCDFEEVELLEEDLMETLAQPLENHGFRWDKDYQIKEQADWIHLEGKRQSTKYAKRYFQEKYGTEAMVYFYESVQQAANEELRIVTAQTNYGIEMYTELEDGKSIKTIAEQIPKVHRESDTTYLYCWSEQGVEEAVATHLQEVKRRLKHTKPINSSMPIEPEKDREKRLEHTYQKGMKKGIYHYDSEKKCYRFTIKGALKYISQGMFMYFLDKKNTPSGHFKVSQKTYREYFNQG